MIPADSRSRAAAPVALWLCALVTGAAQATAPDIEFVSGLTQRRLFPLAERYLRERLASQSLSADDRIELTIALSRTLAEHALHTPRSQREPLWQAATQSIENFRAASADHPRRVLVDMQSALTVLARGELARQESDVGAPGAPSLEEARRELQQAITQLRAVGEQVETLLRTANNVEGEALTETELLSLQRNVRYQTARALRNQAVCYASKSAERSDALLQALELLTPLAQLEPLDSLIWKARLDEATCLRLSGRSADALARLDAIDAARAPSRITLEARAERVRLALDQGETNRALEVFRAGRELSGQTSAELDLAHVEAFIVLWKRAVQQQEEKVARQWQDRMATMVRVMESLYGPYWTRRAEQLLSASADEKSSDANLEVLVRAAKNHYLRQELDEAVIAYQRAAKAAHLSDRAKSLELYLAAALIERRRNRWPAAIDLLQTTSRALKEVPKAPTVHLQAVVDAAQLARDGEKESLATYVRLLQEQIEIWPHDPTSDQARMWLGQLWEHEGKLAQALTAYRAISLTNTAADNSAIDATARLQAEIFEQNRAAGKLSDAAIVDAVAYFENIARGDRTSTDEPWSHAQRQAALHAARLRLQFTTDGFAQAQRLLEAALKAAGDASDEWKSQASSLLVVAQAGAGDRSAAQETLRQLFGGSTLRQLEMLRGLHEIGERSSPAVAREIAKLQLEVIDKLEAAASKLSADQRKGFELISAHALVADGQASTALKKLEQLSREYPDDGEVQRRYAMLLSMIEERPSQLAARTAWRNVLRRTPPDTPAWYEAKLALAQAQFALGEKQEAAQMIEVLQTLQPELGGPAIKAKFLNLLKRCRE